MAENNILRDWFDRNAFLTALAAGILAAAVAAAVVLRQPAEYRAEIRILQAGKLSADETEALAKAPGTAAAAAALPVVSGYNLNAADFFNGATVQQLLDEGLLRLSVTDADSNRAAARARAWAQAVCAAAGEAEDAGCSDAGLADPARLDNFLGWKTLTAFLVIGALVYAGAVGQNRRMKRRS